MRQTLSELGPRYDTNSLGVTVMSNSGELSERLDESMQLLQNMKKSDNSRPFREELAGLERKLTVARERIDYFVEVEGELTDACQVFALYSLDVQLGRLRHLLKDLCLSWQDVCSALEEKSAAGILEVTSDCVDQELITIKHAVMSVHAEIAAFLRTRARVFPRLSLAMQSARPSPSVASVTKLLGGGDIPTMFPQIKRVHVVHSKRGYLAAVGYTHLCGQEKKFAKPIRVSDIPSDLFLSQLHNQTRQMFRNEVMESIAAHRQQKQPQQAPAPPATAATASAGPQSAAPTTTPTLAGNLGHLSPHALLVGRLVLFWSRLSSAMADSDAHGFRRWLIRMSDAQAAKIAAIQGAYTALRAGPASEEAVAANRCSLGAEMYVQEKVHAFLEAVAGPNATDGGMAEAQFLWNDCLKYVLQKDTGELSLIYRDKVS